MLCFFENGHILWLNISSMGEHGLLARTHSVFSSSKRETSPDLILWWSEPIYIIKDTSALRLHMLHNVLINHPRSFRPYKRSRLTLFISLLLISYFFTLHVSVQFNCTKQIGTGKFNVFWIRERNSRVICNYIKLHI